MKKTDFEKERRALREINTRICEMNPITNDKNELVYDWCVFCGAGCSTHIGINYTITHKPDCLWMQARALAKKLK